MSDELDNIEDFEAKETARKLPVGWLMVYIGLILWGIYYFAMYTPAISGWTQASAYEQSLQK